LPPLPPVVRTGEQPAAPAPEPAPERRPLTPRDVIAALAYVACAVVMVFCLMEATSR
jgi:hypothetical protein